MENSSFPLLDVDKVRIYLPSDLFDDHFDLNAIPRCVKPFPSSLLGFKALFVLSIPTNLVPALMDEKTGEFLHRVLKVCEDSGLDFFSVVDHQYENLKNICLQGSLDDILEVIEFLRQLIEAEASKPCSDVFSPYGCSFPGDCFHRHYFVPAGRVIDVVGRADHINSLGSQSFVQICLASHLRGALIGLKGAIVKGICRRHRIIHFDIKHHPYYQNMEYIETEGTLEQVIGAIKNVKEILAPHATQSS